MATQPHQNLSMACYEHATGKIRPTQFDDEHRAYMDWCEGKVSQWRAICQDFGYTHDVWEIRSLTGSITYHDWLRREVGLVAHDLYGSPRFTAKTAS